MIRLLSLQLLNCCSPVKIILSFVITYRSEYDLLHLSVNNAAHVESCNPRRALKSIELDWRSRRALEHKLKGRNYRNALQF